MSEILPYFYIANGMASAWVVVGKLIVEIGFVKYFTTCSWNKTILVSVAMNLASTILGIIVIVGSCTVMLICPRISSLMYVYPCHWSVWLFYCFLCTVINTLIEGGVIKLILKLKFQNTYKWLTVANAITVAMCVIYASVSNIQL